MLQFTNSASDLAGVIRLGSPLGENLLDSNGSRVPTSLPLVGTRLPYPGVS